jgi:PAS domain S-box-containing protein
MKTLFSGPIHKSLTIIVLLAALPAMALNIYTMLESRWHAETDARERTLDLLHSLGTMQAGITSEAKVLLTTLVRMPEVENGDRASCDQRFTKLLGDHAELTNIFLTDPDGRVIASGLPDFRGKDLSDRLYFQEVRTTQDFRVGIYNVGRSSGVPILVFALPVTTGEGRFLGVLGASFKLALYQAFLDALHLPAQIRIGLFDRDGRRILAYPAAEARPPGQLLAPALWAPIARATTDEGMFDDGQARGERTLVAYSRLRLTPADAPYVTAVVSLARAKAFRQGRNQFLRNMALLVVAVFLTLLIARRMGRVALLTDLDRLMTAAARLGDGDLTARAAAASGSRETRQLAAIFNDMAQALQAREFELRQTGEKLARTQNLLNNILESMPSAVIALDEQGLVTHFNASAQILCDLPREKALGRPASEALPLLAAHLDKLQLALRQRQVQRVEHASLERDDAQRLLDLQFYPLVANGLTGAVIRLDDVTERERLREMMIQSEKMASVGGLAAGMAHEINNPLSSILQAAQVCLMQLNPSIPANQAAATDCGCSMETIRCYAENRRILKFLDGIREAGLRAAQIVSSMLEFSRKSESRRAPADINAILEHSLALAATDYDLKKKYDFRRIAIVRDFAPDLPAVVCTRTEIEQVVLNLLKNAAQAMAGVPGGTPEPTIVLRTRRVGEAVRIEVADNGPGMDERVRKRVFEPFFTTKEPGHGTGLGLSVSYCIIATNHGGTLQVDAQPGKGATFTIELPLGGAA